MSKGFTNYAWMLLLPVLLLACEHKGKAGEKEANEKPKITESDEQIVDKESERKTRVQALVKQLADESIEPRQSAFAKLRDIVVRKRDIPNLTNQIDRINRPEAKAALQELISFLSFRWRLTENGWTDDISKCEKAYRQEFVSSGWEINFSQGSLRPGERIISKLVVFDLSGKAQNREEAVNLIMNLEPEALDLGHSWKSISFLNLLTNLEEVTLWGSVTDLTPLQGLPKLERLNLVEANDNIININELVNLKELSIVNTPFSDLTSLRGLSDLRVLSLEGTKVTELAPLKKLFKLGRLNLKNTPVNDLSPLKGMPHLREIDLSNTKVTNLTPLRDIPNLEVVYFKNNRYVDISPFIGASFVIIK